MTEAKILVLSEDMRITLAKAAKLFPGRQLDEVFNRTLADFSTGRVPLAFYEIRRRDVPSVFCSFLKLQSKGHASRYIETDETEFREVLRVEASLLNAIMLALRLVLDVILKIVSPNASDGGAALPSIVSGAEPQLIVKPYVPTWKRQSQIIGYDGPSL